PHTEHEFDSASYGKTPSASGTSEEMNLDFDLSKIANGDSGNSDLGGNGAGDVNLVSDIDMDQWLQFPPEGVNDSDDTFMAGMFTNEGIEQGLSWAFGGDAAEVPA